MNTSIVSYKNDRFPPQIVAHSSGPGPPSTGPNQQSVQDRLR
jgi:hypothetical protein